MMDQLQLRFLGDPSITLPNEECHQHLPGKALALLCYLAVTGVDQTRGTMASLLWSDFPEQRARGNLRDLLSILRRTSLAPYLQIDRHAIAFSSDLPFWLDTAEFEKGLQQTTLAGSPDLAGLEASLTLYRGEFLTGFQIPKAALFDEWLMIQRQAIHLSAIEALQQLIDGYLESGRYKLAIRHAEHLLIFDPWREKAHRNLMLLHLLGGEADAALQQYAHCRQILDEELGVMPSIETETLYQNILKQVNPSTKMLFEPGVSLQPDHFSDRQALLANNIPSQVTPFFGREKEQRAIDNVLRDHAGRLITIFGVGGSGKTRLALAIAEKQVEAIERDGSFRFPDGVFFVPLQSAEAPDEIIPAFCQALGFQPAEELQAGRSAETQLLDYLSRKKLLLIVDNFEQLIDDGVEYLAKIHRAAAGVHILVTSRQRLGLQGERLYALNGLPYPASTADGSGAGQLQRHYASIALFVAGAQRVVSNFHLQEEEVPALIRLCGLVDGLPLAIELAAGWTNVLSLTAIVAEIEQGFSILESELHDLPERHRSMEAVFDVSWRQLAPAEQEVFARLCAFRGGFTREAAGQIAGASLRQLASLANKALIEFDKKAERYQIHRLVQQFGAAKLAQNPDNEQKTNDRHCQYYCTALNHWDSQLKQGAQLEALSELEKENANTRAAWYHAVQQSKVLQLDLAADGLYRFYLWRRRFHNADTACRKAEEILAPPLIGSARKKSPEEEKVLAKIQIWHSVFTNQAAASSLVENALVILESPYLASLDTRQESAFALQRAADLVFSIDGQQAEQLYGRSLTLYRELDDDWGRAKILTCLGWLAAHNGRTAAAQQLGEEALNLVRTSGDMKRKADVLWLLGTLSAQKGHFEESGRLLGECLDIRQTLGDRLTDIAAGPIDLGMPLTWIGRMSEAEAIREETLALYEAQGTPEQIALAYVRLATSKLHVGQFDATERFARIGLQRCRQVGNDRGAALALWLLAVLYNFMDDVEQAEPYLQESLAIFRTIEDAHELGWVFGLYADIMRRRGRVADAREYICKSLHAASGILGLITIISAFICHVNLLADEGQYELAVEFGALLDKQPFASQSQVGKIGYAQRLQDIAARLPPGVVARARSRGLMRDIRETAAELLLELEPFIVD